MNNTIAKAIDVISNSLEEKCEARNALMFLQDYITNNCIQIGIDYWQSFFDILYADWKDCEGNIVDHTFRIVYKKRTDDTEEAQ